MHGFQQVLCPYDKALQPDGQKRNSKWKQDTDLKIVQLDEYDTFIGMDCSPPKKVS